MCSTQIDILFSLALHSFPAMPLKYLYRRHDVKRLPNKPVITDITFSFIFLHDSFKYVRGAFKLSGILIFFSGMEADRNVKVVGGDVAVL